MAWGDRLSEEREGVHLNDQIVTGWLSRGAAILVLGWFAGTASAASIVELVESKPVETILDEPTMRDTRVVWAEMINGARASLDIAAFYIQDARGEPLEPVLAAITAAARRGVRVRILADATFAAKYPESFDALVRAGNTVVRRIPITTISGGVMHAKYFVVDGVDAFLGSQNFDWKALKHIHEIGVRVRDASFAASVEQLFELDWALAVASPRVRQVLLARSANVLSASHPLELRIRGRTVRLAPAYSPRILNRKGMDWEEDRLVALMGSARNEILIQVLEYSAIDHGRLYAALEDAIRDAAARGVSVKMILSDWSTRQPAIGFIKSLSVVPGVQIKISTLPEARSGFISFARVEHCKYLVVDSDKCYVGTGNWEKSYFHTTRNLGVSIQDDRLTGQLRSVFFRDWNGPYVQPVNIRRNYPPPVVNKPGAP